MAGEEFMGEVPFTDVYFNGIVRDLEGRKMSKTLGNSADPLDIIEKYGADALRFTIVYQTPYGADSRFSNDSSEFGRGFCIKIWNAFRFLQMGFDGVEPDPNWADGSQDTVGKWILSRLAGTLKDVESDLASYRFANAASRIYNFFWGEFCDWYVEFLKPQIKDGDEAAKAKLLGRTRYILDACLRMLHPFMPFITEEIWQQMRGEDTDSAFLMAQEWPKVPEKFVDTAADEAITLLQELITATRAVRKTNQLPGTARLDLYFECNEKQKTILEQNESLVGALARTGSLTFNQEAPKGSAAIPLTGMNAFVDMSEFLDVDAEISKIEKQLEKLEKEKGRLESRLNNPGFMAKAPEQVVKKSREECQELERKIQTLIDGKSELEQLK